MEFQNFIYLLLTCIWLTGLLWHQLLFTKVGKRNENLCCKKISRSLKLD